uniref:Uncharacterized protein n=1 Tax=Romanomermis culicivorax TaxID=13658 RepID=A0A915IBD0_ROMCU
ILNKTSNKNAFKDKNSDEKQIVNEEINELIVSLGLLALDKLLFISCTDYMLLALSGIILHPSLTAVTDASSVETDPDFKLIILLILFPDVLAKARCRQEGEKEIERRWGRSGPQERTILDDAVKSALQHLPCNESWGKVPARRGVRRNPVFREQRET